MIIEDTINRVIEILSRSPEIKARYSAELENFSQRLNLSKRNKYRLGVIGVTSSGKSTMINALLGERLLPVGAKPTSSQLVCCCKGKKRCANIYFNNGVVEHIKDENLTSEVVKRYGDENENSRNKEGVKQIDISSPNFPFSENIVLIDSPGLNAFGYELHDKLTMNSLLPTIDICIFVTTCKSNSDEGMKSVLDILAEHRMPTIIVQNMIDSIKPSVDGRKTKEVVAREHKARIQKIIDASKIVDKSSVKIIQISSIKALEAIESKDKNEMEKLLKQAQHQQLIRSVKKEFKQICPRIDGARIKNLRNEIDRIAENAEMDGKSITEATPCIYDGNIEKEYEKYKCIKKEAEQVIMLSLDKLQKKLEDELVRTMSFDQSFKARINSISTDSTETICQQMNILNKKVREVCGMLNIDARNILSDFRFENPNVIIHTKQQINPHGKYVEGNRHWYTLWLFKGKGHYEPTIETVIDEEATIRDAKQEFKRVITRYGRIVEDWGKSIDSTKEKLDKEMENRRKEQENRRKKQLESQLSLKIAIELRKIARSLPQEIVNSLPQEELSTPSIQTKDMGVKVQQCVQNEYPCYECKNVYQLAVKYRQSIHKFTIDTIVKRESYNFIVGWDEEREIRLKKYFFGDECINRKLRTLHRPKNITIDTGIAQINYFILVNATQYGYALNEVKDLNLKRLKPNHVLYLVIQDFREIINGASVDETLENMLQICPRLNIKKKATILILDDNPIYNLVALEAQNLSTHTFADEVRILGKLQEKFSFLFPKDREGKESMNKIILSIIKKFGRTCSSVA